MTVCSLGECNIIGEPYTAAATCESLTQDLILSVHNTIRCNRTIQPEPTAKPLLPSDDPTNISLIHCQ